MKNYKFEIRNPKLEINLNDPIGKHEIRSAKPETNSKVQKKQNSKQMRFGFGVLELPNFWFVLYPFVSNFDIRISDLT